VSSSAWRVCSEPSCPELTQAPRCQAHTQAREQARGSRQARGYGIEHERLRTSWLRRVAAGLIDCARCGLRISPLEAWDLDHTDDRQAYLGPSHRACNRAAR
jgi:hypothetical protein